MSKEGRGNSSLAHTTKPHVAGRCPNGNVVSAKGHYPLSAGHIPDGKVPCSKINFDRRGRPRREWGRLVEAFQLPIRFSSRVGKLQVTVCSAPTNNESRDDRETNTQKQEDTNKQIAAATYTCATSDPSRSPTFVTVKRTFALWLLPCSICSDHRTSTFLQHRFAPEWTQKTTLDQSPHLEI